MSRRRTAERVVIEAAQEWVHAKRDFTAADVRTSELAQRVITAGHQVAAAVDRLEALGLEDPTAVRTIALPSATSTDAAAYMSKRVHNVVGLVFGQILSANRAGGIGLTTDAIEVRLRRSHQSVSPRVTDLRDQGWIAPSGFTRKTRYGQDAVVWWPTDAALAAARGVPEWSWG
jgi:hypothetical protein